jgi:PPM family protein phosphatase
VTVLRSGSATDVGRVRKINQDLPLEASNLYAVADGMGGHVGGEVAARVAIDALASAFKREPTSEGLQRAFAEANRAVWREGQERSELRGMGTTLTAVALVGGNDGHDMLALANVGDSRAYVYSEGQVVQVTADHSLAEERMRHGEITEEEAAVHPQRHILTRVLGVTSDVETDMWELQLRSGDRVVLCSDGLSNEVGLDEMAGILAGVGDPGEAARQLVDAANEHGGSDNITAVVVDVLVGEESTGAASVVIPIGRGAGAPLVIAQGAAGAAGTGQLPAVAPAETPAAPPAPFPPPPSDDAGEGPVTQQIDALAPGSQLGFTGVVPRVTREGSGSGEFFLGSAEAVPLARTSVRAPLPARPFVPPPPNESRGARRRRLGIPRRITLRVLLFALLVIAIPVGAFFAIRWYAYDNWFVSTHGEQIVIKQGYPNGVLWFDPRVVNHTGVTTKQVLPTGLSQIRSGVSEPSLADAEHYVANLHQEYAFLKSAAKKAKESTTTTVAGIGPSGQIPTTTTVPPSTTSTTAAVTGTVAPTTTVP